jgi:hypothetical protein
MTSQLLGIYSRRAGKSLHTSCLRCWQSLTFLSDSKWALGPTEKNVRKNYSCRITVGLSFDWICPLLILATTAQIRITSRVFKYELTAFSDRLFTILCDFGTIIPRLTACECKTRTKCGYRTDRSAFQQTLDIAHQTGDLPFPEFCLSRKRLCLKAEP